MQDFINFLNERRVSGGEPTFPGMKLPRTAAPKRVSNTINKKVGEMSADEMSRHKAKQAAGKAWHEAHPVHPDNVIRHWNASTAEEKAKGMVWYRHSARYNKEVAHDTGISPVTMSGLTANYSPQSDWHSNMLNAARVAAQKQGVGGKSQKPFEGRKIMASDKQRLAANAMLAGKHPMAVLKGSKVRNFQGLTLKGRDPVPTRPRLVIDRHAYSVAAGSRISDEAFGQAGLQNPKNYGKVEASYIAATRHINRTGGFKRGDFNYVNPHQVQAVTWLTRQRMNDEEDSKRIVMDKINKEVSTKGPFLPGLEPSEEPAKLGTVAWGKNRGGSKQRWQAYASKHHPQLLGMFEEKEHKGFVEFLHEKSLRRPRKPGQAVIGLGGRNYEKNIWKALHASNLVDPHGHTAGSSASAADTQMVVKAGRQNLEIKAAKGAMWGQAELHHTGQAWDLSPRFITHYPATSEQIRQSGFLTDINKKWKAPTGDYDKDLAQGNVYRIVKGTKAIAAHYGQDRRTPYVQVGGSGLFHFDKDVAGLGTTGLTGDTQFRARRKYRGINPATGKPSYGALIVFGLRNANKSALNLENPQHVQTISLKHAVIRSSGIH